MGVGRVVAFGVLYTLAALLGDQKTKGLVYSAMSWQRTSSGVTKGGVVGRELAECRLDEVLAVDTQCGGQLTKEARAGLLRA